MKSDDVVEEKYEEFINEEKEKAIYEMSNQVDIDSMVIKEMVSEYQFTSVIPNQMIRRNVKGKLLEKNKKMNDLRDFIVEISDI
jgi:hypothetical protein